MRSAQNVERHRRPICEAAPARLDGGVAVACKDGALVHAADLRRAAAREAHKLDDVAREQRHRRRTHRERDCAEQHVAAAQRRAHVDADELGTVHRVVDRAREAIHRTRRALRRLKDIWVKEDFDLVRDQPAARRVGTHGHVEPATLLLELQAVTRTKVDVVEHRTQVGCDKLRAEHRRTAAHALRRHAHVLVVVGVHREAALIVGRECARHAAVEAKQIAHRDPVERRRIRKLAAVVKAHRRHRLRARAILAGKRQLAARRAQARQPERHTHHARRLH